MYAGAAAAYIRKVVNRVGGLKLLRLCIIPIITANISSLKVKLQDFHIYFDW